ncbi:MAG TPA: thioesterase family protein [Solirubrobacteraceae bacterium]|jgi:acyl-coenzyme A thioesterase PaaI-like protein
MSTQSTTSAARAIGTESIFRDEGEGHFVPTEQARGPWDPRALHGGAPAALIAAAFERMEPGSELPFARLSFSFLRPIPMAPLRLSTHMTRPGRRVQELHADLHAGEVLVCQARALRIVPAPEQLPELAARLLAERAQAPLPGPEGAHPVHFALDDPERKSFAASAMEMRFLRGAPLTGELPEQDSTAAHQPRGAAQVWMRLRHPLLPGEPLSSIARVAATADFGNGVSAVLPFERYLFINADLAISLDRRAEGEWIALDARTLLHPGGIGWAQSVLHDERGPFGVATQALVVQPR